MDSNFIIQLAKDLGFAFCFCIADLNFTFYQIISVRKRGRQIARTSDHRHPRPRIFLEPSRPRLLSLRHRHPRRRHHALPRAADHRVAEHAQEEESSLHHCAQQDRQDLRVEVKQAQGKCNLKSVEGFFKQNIFYFLFSSFRFCYGSF